MNQIELHPYFTQEKLRAFNDGNAIATEAWSPIAQGAVLKDPVVNELAASYGRTPAQIVLRWHIQLGNIVFPKSVTPERIAENFDLFGFELAPQDMERISALDKDERTGPDPDTFDMIARLSGFRPADVSWPGYEASGAGRAMSITPGSRLSGPRSRARLTRSGPTWPGALRRDHWQHIHAPK